jgi:hypothetical protein
MFYGQGLLIPLLAVRGSLPDAWQSQAEVRLLFNTRTEASLSHPFHLSTCVQELREGME